MKNVDFYFWILPQTPPKKPKLTRWRMTMEDGLRQFPEGKPELSSKETRQISEDEASGRFRGHFTQSYAPKIDPID